MTEDNKQGRRLQKIARELNVGIATIAEFLSKKGKPIDTNPNNKVSDEIYELLLSEFQTEKSVKEKSQQLNFNTAKKQSITIEEQKNEETVAEEDDKELIIKNINSFPIGERVEELKPQVKVLGKIDLNTPKKASPAPTPSSETPVVKDQTNATKETATPQSSTSTQKNEVNKEKQATVSSVKSNQDKDAKPEKTENVEKKVTEPTDKAPVIQKDEPKISIENTPTEQKKEVVEPVIEEGDSDKHDNFHKTEYQKLEGPTILGKIDLPSRVEVKKQPVASSTGSMDSKKKKRKRIRKEGEKIVDNKPGQQAGNVGDNNRQGGYQQGNRGPGSQPQNDRQNQQGGQNRQNQNTGIGKKSKKPDKSAKVEINDDEIQKQIRETLARLSGGSGKSKASKYRRQKRELFSERMQVEQEMSEENKMTLKVTEFVTANELATLMNVPVTKVIATCMSLGLFVSINQRLDAETLTIVAEEFGYKLEFVSVELQEAIKEEADTEDVLITRPPIVTVMGHVDHGKTSLLDYIRKANVIAGEAGGITQHIGAYCVQLENGKQITFLDTPGHEAFTAMRARGAQVTDVAIIVIAADDTVMPQTVEAINHAQAAGVPIVFAFNKIDKPGANPDKIREALANMNLLVEDWGGKYQCQEISAKKGLNVEALLDKVLLESEMLELTANPDRLASGTVIESELDKGRGYVSTILVQKGTLRIGDPILAGCYFGRVKAMFNERNQPIKEAGPSTPVLVLGISGAPQAGDKFNVMSDEREAKEIATKRLQLQREQGIRTQKHVTLDEIGRRIAIGDFKELNIIVKGDVDGSIEALSDSLIKLSTPKIQVNVIHKSVGQVTESDVLLASASNAIIIAFQVRPSLNAKKLAEKEEIDIRLYSIIYDAINEIKDAMEGMLSPEIQEKITCNLEIKETFKITKVGTIAGCLVLEGRIARSSKVRLIRNGIVIYTGVLGSLKRYKDDVKEAIAGQECGLNIANFNDIKVGDIVEGYEEIEVKAKL